MSIDIDAPYKSRIREALSDSGVRKAVDRAMGQLAQRRERAVNAIDNETMRDEAREIREHAVRNLPALLVELETNLIRNGCEVHWARTGDEANDILKEIARTRKVKTAIKSKSMVTEEIHLNTSLEEIGVKVVETDLGEYIIQLADEPPSHIVAPVIHKRVEDISELFQNELGMEPTLDPSIMCDAARKELRKHFLAADMGISGCNFAIAETGTICIITNEGNGRMVSSLPPVHVVVAGIEKIVPKVEDAILLWQAATRNATGQDASVYFSMTSGPKKSNHADGPKEVHVILVDNARTNVMEKGYADALMCIRCGACMDVCPVYREIGGHAYGRTAYPGPIGSILTPLMNENIDIGKDLPFASSLCGACKDACPVKIDLPRLLLELRNDLSEEKITSPFQRFLVKSFAWILKRPKRYLIATKIAGLTQKFSVRSTQTFSNLPSPFNHWTKSRVLQKPSSKTFKEIWKNSSADLPVWKTPSPEWKDRGFINDDETQESNR